MNKLIQKLTGGRSVAKGMKLLYPIEGTLFRVEVVSIDFREHAVKARIRPVDGVGTMHVDPQKLVDDTAAARDRFRRQNEASHFKRENPYRYSSLAMNRNTIARMIGALPKKEKAKAESRCQNVPVSKLDEASLRDIYEFIVRLKFGLAENDTDGSDD